jgi:hypothetical protein
MEKFNTLLYYWSFYKNRFRPWFSVKNT